MDKVGRSTVAATRKPSANQNVPALRGLFNQISSKGGTLEKRGDSYYLKAAVQNSSKTGLKEVKVDAKLAEAILKAESTGGQTSLREVVENILPAIRDGGRYGQGEGVLVRMLLAATDDRKHVVLNGVNINLTNPAEKELKHDLHSFWGTLGAKARWGKQEVIKPDGSPI
jgi:predicted AAA+ superfamily ATPase